MSSGAGVASLTVVQRKAIGVIEAIAAQISVGTAVTVSGALVGFPIFSAQAVRYLIGTGLLVGGAAIAGRLPPVPRRREWLWLAALTGTAIVLFNYALVRAVEHAEPAAVGVIVAAVPLALAIAGPLQRGERPAPMLLAAAVIVVVGAALVEGGGRVNATGLAWSAVVLFGEVCFTLFAVPVIERLTPIGVSVWTCVLATAAFTSLAVIDRGADALVAPAAKQWAAILYLAIVLTALAFVWWFSAVRNLSGEVAGLFCGVIPIAAAVSGLFNGATTVNARVLGGTAIVAAGIVVGLASQRRR